MAGLQVSLQDLVEHSRDERSLKRGVDPADVSFSRLCGMDAADVSVFRTYTRQHLLLIIVRCPKRTARAWHGVVAPKPLATKDKTGTSGVVVQKNGNIFVSDYDLMSAWRARPGGFEKILVSAEGGAARGAWSIEARELVRGLNTKLISRIQHGCQDDYISPKNPGVGANDHFAAFREGRSVYLLSASQCAEYYSSTGLRWPYDGNGKFMV